MYGKLQNGVLIYAPNILNGKINPSEATLRAEGYLPVIFSDAPKIEEGYILTCKWVEKEGCIWQKWRVTKDNSPLSVEVLSDIFLRQHIQEIEVDDSIALRMKDFYPEWELGKAYAVENKLTRNSKLYKVI